MNVDTSRDLAAAGLTVCLACEGTRTVRIHNGGFVFDAECEDCGPAFIPGHDDYPEVLNAMREEDRCRPNRTER